MLIAAMLLPECDAAPGCLGDFLRHPFRVIVFPIPHDLPAESPEQRIGFCVTLNVALELR